MDVNARVWELIQRGRVAQPANQLLPKYNALADPPGAEELGRLLAEGIRPLGATIAVVWDDVGDAVLGYVVGRELGVPVVRCYNAEGLVGFVGPLPAASRAVLVADAFRDVADVRAMRALVAQQGGTVVAAAALMATEVLAEIPSAFSLVAAPEEMADGEHVRGDAR
ncbi:MAG: hypothetical protein HYX52_06000 [Chloroflexi bacterium]|nr:hypothetical protein [Chloroflexota bacterium]